MKDIEVIPYEMVGEWVGSLTRFDGQFIVHLKDDLCQYNFDREEDADAFIREQWVYDRDCGCCIRRYGG